MFDANEGKIVHYFPLASDNARVTAGKDHLVIAYLDTELFTPGTGSRRKN